MTARDSSHVGTATSAGATSRGGQLRRLRDAYLGHFCVAQRWVAIEEGISLGWYDPHEGPLDGAGPGASTAPHTSAPPDSIPDGTAR